MQVIISSEDTRSLCPSTYAACSKHSRRVLSPHYYYYLVAPRPARAANTPIRSVLGRGPSQCHSSYWGTHRVFGMAAVSMQKLQLPAMVTLCVGVCPTSRCVHGTTNPPFCDGGPQTRFFLPSFLEETAKKACPRFTRPGERHCWVFDQSGNHSGSDWLLENFKWGPSLFCFFNCKDFFVALVVCLVASFHRHDLECK